MRSASVRLMPSTRARSSMLAAITPCSPPKCSSRRLRRVGPTEPISSRREAVRALPRARAVAGDREAVRLVAHLLDEVQRRVVRRQAARLLLARDEELLHAGLALHALGHADHRGSRAGPGRPSSRRAALSWPMPPSIRIRSGVLALAVGELAVAHCRARSASRRSRRRAPRPSRCSGGTPSSASRPCRRRRTRRPSPRPSCG